MAWIPHAIMILWKGRPESMSGTVSRTAVRLAAGLFGIALIASGQSRPSGSQSKAASSEWRQKDTEWAYYSADVRGSRYRPLDQINASNFNKLEVAWRFK